MPRGKRLSSAERRAQLIEVGRGVFSRHGYEAASVEEIARAAEVSKPIIYEHFGGKEGLFAVIVDREMETVYTLIAGAISTGTARDRFEQAVVAFLTYVRDRPEGFAVLTRDAPTSMHGGGMKSVISEVALRVGEIFAQQFTLAGYDPKVAPIYANAMIGMVVMVGQYLTDNPEQPLDLVADHLAAIGWMGLRHLPQDPKRGE